MELNKLLLVGVFTSSLLFAAESRIQVPMSATVLSVENNGQLSAIDAYQDGIGIYTIDALDGSRISNSEMNNLVYKYGQKAKDEGVTLKDYVNANGTSGEKALVVGKFKPMVIVNDTLCDDNNPLTVEDKYVNGICIGRTLDYVNNFRTVFENGKSNLGGSINFEQTSIGSYRIEGNRIGEKGYVSDNLQNLRNKGISKIIINVNSSTCGYGFLGGSYKDMYLSNYNYQISFAKYVVDFTNMTANVTPSYGIEAKTINLNGYDLSNIVMGSASATSQTCEQKWLIDLIY